MKIVAFLQCQWFKNPARMRHIYELHGNTPELRAELNATFLFFGCLSGKRLKASFGDLCDSIIWEESTKEIGGESSFKPLPDPAHIIAVLDYFKPDLIITFGKVAHHAVANLTAIPIISAPHPAARHSTICAELTVAAARVRSFIFDKRYCKQDG